MSKLPFLLFSFLVISGGAHAAIHTEHVLYEHNGKALKGYLAYEDSIDVKRPGVLIVHEWRGFGDYVKYRAEQLAANGYVAFALDMYGEGVYAADHAEAAGLSGVYLKDRTLMRERALAGLGVLMQHSLVDGTKTAAIGYCFGGTTVLELARGGASVIGVASFHGKLQTPSPAAEGDIHAKVLVLHGGKDPHVSDVEVVAFQNEMKAANADWEMITYGQAMHSFTVPDANMPEKGVAYNEEADERSWQALNDFFRRLFSEA